MQGEAIAEETNLNKTETILKKYQCIQYGLTEGLEKFKVCSGCKASRYCSEKCRKNGWKTHKVICQSIQFLDEQESTSKIGLGDSKDEKMFRSHLTPTEHQKVAKLIGEKCEINCLLDGIDTKALLDSGAQVSVLSRSFLAEQCPDTKVRNVKELLGDQNLELLAVNNLSVPYEGFVEITLTLVGKKDNFSIRVPFLVTSAKIDQTFIGFNVICDYFRDYLYHVSDFTVFTDCNPLTYVLTTAKLNAAGFRWAAELADFHFSIKYMPLVFY